VRGFRRVLFLLLAGTQLLLAADATAYQARLGWNPSENAAGYKLSIAFDGREYPLIDIGSVAPEPDGVCRVVVSGLPLGPTATFAVVSYDASAAESASSNSLSIDYGLAAAIVDSDLDGLTDGEEDLDLDQYVDPRETDPRDPDSDDDGWWDGIEVSTGTDPRDANDPPIAPIDCEPADCDDSNPCTDDMCVNGICSHFDNISPCDDGRFCTVTDTCNAGTCNGALRSCDDGVACTFDRCSDTDAACLHDPLDAFCEDANACNGAEHCSPQAGCVAGLPLECDNGVYCDGLERCEPAVGCVAGSAPSCSDGIGCTEDLCDAAADACVNVPRADRCDDGNPCTDDVCSPASDCTATPNTSSCDDGIACTEGDICGDGSCNGVPSCGPGEVCDLETGGCEPATADSDRDGLMNLEDPCPADPRNACFGSVAVDRRHGSIIRINSNASDTDCAGLRTDCRGEVWVADFGYHESARARSCNRKRDDWHCEIGGIGELFGCSSEQTQDLFRCAAGDWDDDAPASYSFDVPAGRYLVNLFFANIRPNGDAEGARIFDIIVEGSPVYTGFDPVAEAGATETAVVRSAVVEVTGTDGLQIHLKSLLGKTVINALEVLAAP